MKVDNLMKVLLSCNRNSASKVTKHNKAKLNRSSNCKVSNKENFKDLFKWIETKANKVDNLYFKKPKVSKSKENQVLLQFNHKTINKIYQML